MDRNLEHLQSSMLASLEMEMEMWLMARSFG
jgi:hypothetical protein